MEKFTVHTGTAVPLRRSDVDTDQIIPAVYLKRVTRTGFEDGLFSAWREDPAFVLNNPAYAGASILVAGPGVRHRLLPGARRLGAAGLRASGPSSRPVRRHLPGQRPQGGPAAGRAAEEGRRGAVGPAWRRDPATAVTVDLVAREVRAGDAAWAFPLDDFSRWRLLEGLDDIGLTLRHEDAITAFEADRPAFLPSVGIAVRPIRTARFAPTGSPVGANPLRHNDFFRARCLCPGCRGHTVRAEWLALSPVARIGREIVNKAELIEALAARLGDRKTATAALDAVLAEIQNAVTKGDKVSITGFGVFEKRVRAARTARNPRTGEAVKVKKTSVPAFRPGAGFKEMVASGKVPKATAPRRRRPRPPPRPRRAKATRPRPPAKTTAAKATGAKAAKAKAAGAKATGTKAAGAKATGAKATTAAKKATAAKATKTTGGEEDRDHQGRPGEEDHRGDEGHRRRRRPPRRRAKSRPRAAKKAHREEGPGQEGRDQALNRAVRKGVHRHGGRPFAVPAPDR